MNLLTCCCGDEHKDDKRWPLVQDFVDKHGETVIVTVPNGNSWRVPRAWIAFHGIREQEVPALADKYGWPRVDD